MPSGVTPSPAQGNILRPSFAYGPARGGLENPAQASWGCGPLDPHWVAETLRTLPFTRDSGPAAKASSSEQGWPTLGGQFEKN